MSFRFVPDVAQGALAQQEETPQQKQARYQTMGQRSARRVYERASGYLRASQVERRPQQEERFQEPSAPPPTPRTNPNEYDISRGGPAPWERVAVTGRNFMDPLGNRGTVMDGGATSITPDVVERNPVYAREPNPETFGSRNESAEREHQLNTRGYYIPGTRI